MEVWRPGVGGHCVGDWAQAQSSIFMPTRTTGCINSRYILCFLAPLVTHVLRRCFPVLDSPFVQRRLVDPKPVVSCREVELELPDDDLFGDDPPQVLP